MEITSKIGDPPERVIHSNLGEALITDACRYLQATNPDSSSVYIEHEGDVKEVTKNLVRHAD